MFLCDIVVEKEGLVSNYVMIMFSNNINKIMFVLKSFLAHSSG